jgi:hypothetical protein
MAIPIQTFSIVIGGPRCNAHCPFCVSKQTGMDPVRNPKPRINWHNLAKAWQMVQVGGATTVLFTGKGEPLLYPGEISSYLGWFKDSCRFLPLTELQTNALLVGDMVSGKTGSPTYRRAAETDRHLESWRELGLDTIAISAVETGTTLNSAVYRKDYPALEATVAYLRGLRYSIRLCIMMMRDGVDTPAKLDQTIEWCLKHDVTQLTVRPIRRPTSTRSDKTSRFVQEHGLTPEAEADIRDWVQRRGHPVLSLIHGATVFDIDGQNVCLADCLTETRQAVTREEGIRSLIFYSNGRTCYSWTHRGAVILDGWPETNES